MRDGVTGGELARTPLVRNVDYSMRYLEGRVSLKEPLGAFADTAFITNHNLGQVAAANRVALDIEYEHRDDDPFQGVATGVQLKQQVLGHAELGGGYVYEAREGGALGYQLGGGHLRIYLDEGTWLQGELLGSQSVDAGNFFSNDGGLSYSALGQSLDVRTDGGVAGPPRRAKVPPTSSRASAARALRPRRRRPAAARHVNTSAGLRRCFHRRAGRPRWRRGRWQVIDDGSLLRWDGVVSGSARRCSQLTEYHAAPRDGDAALRAQGRARSCCR